MSAFGSAKWADIADLQDAGLLELTPKSLFLGNFQDKTDILHNGEQHVLTIAPPGAGKTSNVIFPVLLSYCGSVVVTDPKAELTPVTIEARRRMGHKIVVLNPWRRELRDGTDGRIDLPDTGFNPLSILRDDYSLHDNVRLIGQLICPTKDGEREPFWNDAARALLCGILLYMVKGGEPVTLPRLRALVRKDKAEMLEFALRMDELAEQLGYPILAEYAREIAGALESEKTWQSINRHAQNVTDIYSTGDPLGDHVSHNEFDPSELKRRDITVYIIVPSNRRDAAKDWFSLVLALFGEAVGKFGQPRPVLFLAEEFGNIGQVGNIGRMLAEYRGAGLRCWLFCQTQYQLGQIYGEQMAKNIIAQCGIHQFFGVNDPDLAASISHRLGSQTAQMSSSSTSQSSSGGTNSGDSHKSFFAGDWPSYSSGSSSGWSSSTTTNYSETSAPLLRPEEVTNLPANQQIIFKAGMRPIKANLVFYKSRPGMHAAAGNNPYDYGKPEPSSAADTSAQPARSSKAKDARFFPKNNLSIWSRYIKILPRTAFLFISFLFLGNVIARIIGDSPSTIDIKDLAIKILVTIALLNAACLIYSFSAFSYFTNYIAVISLALLIAIVSIINNGPDNDLIITVLFGGIIFGIIGFHLLNWVTKPLRSLENRPK